MCRTTQLYAVELPEHPDIVRMQLNVKLPPDRPRGQINEMPLPPVGGGMLVEIAIVIDGDTVEEDLQRLIPREEEETFVYARIGRNVDAHPDIVRSLGNGDAKLGVEPPPLPLVLWKGGYTFRR